MTSRRATNHLGQAKKTNWVTLALAVAGVVIVIAGITQLKAMRTPQPRPADISATGGRGEQLKRALDANMPTMVSMHSKDCIPCKNLMQVMEQVYPEYAEQVVLVDVDVYDEANLGIMRALGLRSIPTTVFFDRRGQSSTRVGSMSPDELRKQIQQRALGG